MNIEALKAKIEVATGMLADKDFHLDETGMFTVIIANGVQITPECIDLDGVIRARLISLFEIIKTYCDDYIAIIKGIGEQQSTPPIDNHQSTIINQQSERVTNA